MCVRVQYRDKGGVSRAKSEFRTEGEAQEWATKNEVAMGDGTRVSPEKNSVKVCDEYHTRRHHKLGFPGDGQPPLDNDLRVPGRQLGVDP